MKPSILIVDHNKMLKKQKIILKIKHKNKKIVKYRIFFASCFLRFYQKLLGCEIKIQHIKDVVDA